MGECGAEAGRVGRLRQLALGCYAQAFLLDAAIDSGKFGPGLRLRQCLQLLDALEALDDVRSVSCNLGEIPELESEGS